MGKLKVFLGRWWFVLALAALMPVYYGVAIYNERNVNYVNNGFFTFWLSGRMMWTGDNPYSTSDWVNGHHNYGATWIPNKIFPYPLPLARVTAPLGLLPIEKAYISWEVLAQFLIAVSILWIAKRYEGLNRQLYAVFVLAAMILNGNVILGLMTGTLAALFLFFLTLSLYFLEKDRPLLAGVALAGLALKPPLLTVVALIGLWLVIKRNWKTAGGIATGGLGLLVTGFLHDPQWLVKFTGASENLLSMRLGNQPTILSYTRLFCAGDMRCAYTAYYLVGLTLVGLFAWFIWKRRNTLSNLAAFSAAIALGVLLPPYIWSYDYVLLIIPICYIAFDLIQRLGTYIYSTLFLLALDIVSMVGLLFFWLNPASDSLTVQRDMWSIWVAILVLVLTWLMAFWRSESNGNFLGHISGSGVNGRQSPG